MAKIQILVGSETGITRGVAANLNTSLSEQGHHVEINEAPSCNDLIRDEEEVLLICTSSTGTGELPANIRPLYQQMYSAPPRIAGRRYGVVSLGDSSFITYAGAATLLDTTFADFGAIRVGEPLLIDAMDTFNPETEAIAWALVWANAL